MTPRERSTGHAELKDAPDSRILVDMGSDVTGNGIAQLVFTVLAACAQFERERIAERIAEIKADQRQRGRHLCDSRPLGFNADLAGSLDPVAAEQVAIRLLEGEQRRGKSLRGIAAVRERTGLRVFHVTARRVLAEARRHA